MLNVDKICRTLSLVELFCEYVNKLTKLNSQKWMCNKRLIAFRRILNDKEDFKSGTIKEKVVFCFRLTPVTGCLESAYAVYPGNTT